MLVILSWGCSRHVQDVQRHDLPVFKGFGKIEINFNDEPLNGDFAYVGDEKEFTVEVYYLGNLIFKGEEKNRKVVYYYMGNLYEEGFITGNLMPVKFQKLKKILADVSAGKEINIKEDDITVESRVNKDGKFIDIVIPERGKIGIFLENGDE